MEPIGLCGGGFVALILFLVAIVGSAALAGGIALALAKLGVTIDRRFKPKASGDPEHKAPEQTLTSTSKTDKMGRGG